MELLLPSRDKLESLTQSIGLLILGQGFSANADFLALAKKLADAIIRLPPFDQTGFGRRHEGRVSIIADSCLGVDLGIESGHNAAVPQLLRLRDNGAALEHFLEMSKTTFMGKEDLLINFWQLAPAAGGTAKLIAILRNPPTPFSSRFEMYSLPLVVVDAVPNDSGWIALIIRGLGQLVGGLADEFERFGPDWHEPPQDWFVNPIDPNQPADNPGRLGPNVVLVAPSNRGQLGMKKIEALAPGVDPIWFEEQTQITPFRSSPEEAFVNDDPNAQIKLELGGGSFRQGVVRHSQQCLMKEAYASAGKDIDASPVGVTSITFCPVCHEVLSRVIGNARTVRGPRRRLDSQRSQFDDTYWEQRETLPVDAKTGTPATEKHITIKDGAEWSCMVAVDPAIGLKISSLKLKKRPGDPMAASDDVAESITFADLAYEKEGGKAELHVADALSNKNSPPRLIVAMNSSGSNRLGIKLTLCWTMADKLAIRADMSLVCRTIKNDFDPGGAAMACKFFPELTLTWSRGGANAKQARRLFGTVNIVANNRIISSNEHNDHGHHDHGGMPPERQAVMLLVDSNSSKTDSLYKVLPSSVSWEKGRLLGSLDSPRGVAAYLAWRAGKPLLPEWSWLFDYGIPVEVGGAEISEVVVWDSYSNDDRGVLERRQSVSWPPLPDSKLGGTPELTVVKVPGQGAFDNIHINADMGLDSVGRPLIAAPFCADLCLHLHFRWGIHAAEVSKNPVPFLGWSRGRHPEANTSIGAPLVPPNQRITLAVKRPDAARTEIRYVAEIMWPHESQKQVVLEQGLGFAFSYGGLGVGERIGLAGIYSRDELIAKTVAPGFVLGIDAFVRAFFRHIYERIRWLSYGYFDAAPAPQQIPGFESDTLNYRRLLEL